MKLKTWIAVAAVLTLVSAIWWTIAQWFFLDLSMDEARLYGIRREVAWIMAVVVYIAWRVTPDKE